MITNIGHTAMKVRDIDESTRFYSDVLGFKEVFRINNEDGSLAIVYMYIAKGQFLELFPGGKGVNANDPKAAGHSHMCYEVDDAERELERIRGKGVTISHELSKGRSGALQFWIADPDGNRIELMQLPPESMQAKAIRLIEGK